MTRTVSACAAGLLVSLGVACGGSDSSEDVGDDTENALGAGTVASAASTSCTTAVVRGLTDQLLAEIACLEPNALGSIESIPNVELDPEVLPVLQKPVIASLTAAAHAYGGTLRLTSALRTLPQQYMLHRWAARGRCGVTLAAPVGQSNHEQGLAIDVSDGSQRKVRTAMGAHAFHWLGSSDPVHFDWDGTGGVDLEGLSVRAFKRLWNRNHPEAKLVEDERYDAKVEAKLMASPAAGFPVGAQCQ